MAIRRFLVKKLVSFFESWNGEIHDAIEQRVHAEYNHAFPADAETPEQRQNTISHMREFYYQRMANTANVMIAGASMAVSLVALIVSVISLLHA